MKKEKEKRKRNSKKKEEELLSKKTCAKEIEALIFILPVRKNIKEN